MTTAKAPVIRCAIYTRVSTDQGLDQEFNSLDAQYEASRAYIRSQAHAGWTEVKTRYDDGGFSGGNTDRPALQQLLADVRARKIDIIVVYKVDRLTRSLADFARLVDLFDTHTVSFVSVTQHFNTTTSMGRLTLNVLLSFAQFEREVTSERIRDKIAASKRKGLWVGGMVPLGYDSRNRQITVNQTEAETVRTIFQHYLELGSLNLLMGDLKRRGIVTKRRTLKTGKAVGGIPFTRGPLAYLLRNRFYIGEVAFKGQILPGEQPAILDRNLFEAVQTKLSQQASHHTAVRMQSDALLMGRLFDDRGNRMRPTHARKNGIKYRYYLSSALIDGRPGDAGSIRRVPAADVEALVVTALREKLPDKNQMDNADLVRSSVRRVEVRRDELIVEVSEALASGLGEQVASNLPFEQLIHIPWQKPPSKKKRELIIPTPAERNIKPIRAETRASLVKAIAKARRWLDELTTGWLQDLTQIATREGCSVRKVEMTISLAFLAPNLVKATLEGRLPDGVGLVKLYDPPAEWSQQYANLGLIAPSSSARASQ